MSPSSDSISRRTFNKQTAATVGLAVAGAIQTRADARPIGANDRVRLGCIGVANRGGQVINGFLANGGVEIAAICDVDKQTLDKMKTRLEGRPDVYTDFRRLLDRKDIDAVLVATPDHWHAIQTIDACNAGKDVYVEKPLSMTVVEGRKMVEAARRNKRVVQVGTHRRSGPIYHQAVRYVRSGKLGKVTVSTAYRISNMTPSGIGRQKSGAPPAHLDWDMWLGPRQFQPYQANISPYKFRWWDHYSSQIANWGVHYFDLMRWLLDVQAPTAVCAMGGRYAVDDDRTVPDTAQVIFELPGGGLMVFGQYEASSIGRLKGEVELRGTQGMFFMSSSGYEVVPERPGQFGSQPHPAEAEQVTQPRVNMDKLHTGNFLDCVRSRKQPNADVEQGHRSTTFSLIANISLALGKRLEWDAERERFTNCDDANALLHYEYRKPWKLD